MRLLFLCCFASCALWAQDEGKILRLSHHVANVDAELRSVKSSIENQQTRLESMREDISKLIQATKDESGELSSSLEGRLAKLEKNFDKVVSDLKQLSTHANETGSCLKKIEKSIKESDAAFEMQAKEIKDLHAALKSIVQAVQKTSSIPSLSVGKYRVQSGDTLDKIAKKCGISLSTLRELNSLQSDTIFVGQELQTAR